MSGPRISSRIAALISRFRRDNKANVVVLFAFSLVPILTAIGCATDYSLAVRMRSKMQSAADGASVASISTNSAGYLAAIQMTSNGSVPAGVTDANNIFNGNVSGVPGYNNLSVTSTVTKTKSMLTSNVQFSAQVPTVFLSIIGYQYLTINGSSSSSASLPLYLDFYLMLDVSGSACRRPMPSRRDSRRSIRTTSRIILPAAHWPAIFLRRAPARMARRNTTRTMHVWAIRSRA